MKFAKLTGSEKEFIAETYKRADNRAGAQELLAKKFEVATRTIRDWAKRLEIVVAPEMDRTIIKAKKKKLNSSRYYLFTWAQSKTPIHKGFFNNMKAYADHLGAEIGVIAGRYKNPTSLFNWKDSDPTWAEEVQPYLTLNRHNVHKYLSIIADAKIVPTAATPMSRFEGFESECSLILGHPRVQMKMVPTLEGYRKKEIFTTGACTLADYTDSTAGIIGEFHHTLGCVIVEIDGDEFYMRHITASDDGSFIDLNTKVDNGSITKGDYVSIYACGDKHFGETDEDMELAGRLMIKKFNPEYVRLDDTFNGHSINPHESKDPVKKFQRVQSGESILDYELNQLRISLNWYNSQPFKIIMPRCNHDIFLDRYISDQDWKKDVPNALTYMKCASLLLSGKAPKGLIPYFVNKWYPNIITLTTDESFRVSQFEQSVHGHRGASGSKGSVVQYKRLSTKMFTMHTHSPSRYDGVITGGTNTLLRVGYNEGPSGWAHCDIIGHKNGKAQQLIFHNYKCTTLI